MHKYAYGTLLSAVVGLTAHAHAESLAPSDPFNPTHPVQFGFTQPPPVKPAPVPVPPKAETPPPIVLEINLKIDDQRRPSTASPTAAANTGEPFDFSKDQQTPAALSVPPERPTAAVSTTGDDAPTPQQAALAPPAATISSTIKIAPATERVQTLSEAPIYIGQSVSLGNTVASDTPCFDHSERSKRVCVIPVDWPASDRPYFDISSVLYRGKKAVVRLDENRRIDVVYGLFAAAQFDRVAGQFVLRFGAATEENLPMALIGNPKARNRVLRWRRVDEEGRNVILELRGNDDLRDILPDEAHGVFRLYRENGLPLFHDLQTTDFLLNTMRVGGS